MISFIKGIPAHIDESSLVLETNGLGYQIQVSPLTLSRIKIGIEAKLYTYLHVRDDGLFLYGFLSEDEISMFNRLITVSGVGPKVAMGILGFMPPSQLLLAIITEDITALSKAPGLGKKTAQRLVLELKDKLKSGVVAADSINPQQQLGGESDNKHDAIDALVALGYNKSEALRAVLEVAVAEMTTAQIIKNALRKLSTL